MALKPAFKNVGLRRNRDAVVAMLLWRAWDRSCLHLAFRLEPAFALHCSALLLAAGSSALLIGLCTVVI
jgi:hypothetical protein